MLERLNKKMEIEFLPKYDKILSTIESCVTKNQLLTCRNWIDNINISSQVNNCSCAFKKVTSYNVEINIKNKLYGIIDLKINRMTKPRNPIGYVRTNNIIMN